jgi:hypothetical protein
MHQSRLKHRGFLVSKELAHGSLANKYIVQFFQAFHRSRKEYVAFAVV